MSVAMDKAKVSGIVGILGAIAAVVTGYASMFILAGFGTFFFTLLIQYGSLKFKFVTLLASAIGLATYFFNSGT